MTGSSAVSQRRSRAVRTDLAYVCARLRARFPRLLPAGTLEQLRGFGSLAELFAALLATDYGPQLKEWVLDTDDMGEWEGALTATYAGRVNQVRSLIEESVPAWTYLVDGDWDVHHLRALLRRLPEKGTGGVSGQAENDPRPLFVPIGTFTRERYREALAAGSWEELCRRIEPWLPAWAGALRSFFETPRDQAVDLRDAELWLDEEHFHWLGACAGRARGRDDASIIRVFVALLVDLTNLRTSLRFLGRHLPREQVHLLYLGGGSLNEETFAAMLAADGVEQIYHQLPHGPLTAVLDRGMLSFANTGRASVFERPGDEQVLRLVHRLARRRPVSVAAPLDYLAKARNEWINLKMIACGVRYGLPVGKVRESLVYV